MLGYSHKETKDENRLALNTLLLKRRGSYAKDKEVETKESNLACSSFERWGDRQTEHVI